MDWKEIGKKILYPPIWLVILLTLVSATLLVIVFVKGWDTTPVAYISYVIAFYTLVVVCAFCIKVLPGWYRAGKQKIYDNQYGNRYMTDVAFKTHVSLYLSLTMNLLYVAVNVLSFFMQRSAWFVILAVYYTILAVMRFLLARYVGKNEVGTGQISELKRARVCAMILMMVNLVLSGAVLMILYQNKGYEYEGMLIYVMAAYTFYITTMAIVNLVKYRKYNSPVMSTSKVINLSAALVSMLALETAMLSQFGADTGPEFRRIMIAATGGGVSLIVVTLSVLLIVWTTREIRKLRINNSET